MWLRVMGGESSFQVCQCCFRCWIFNPFSPHTSAEKFLVQGIKINTPHYLAKLENVLPGVSSYTIIVSQLESLSTIYYSLRVGSPLTCPPLAVPHC